MKSSFFVSARASNLRGFIVCFFLLLASYYFEYVRNMTPCLLCLLQRWAVGVLAVLFFMAFLHNPKRAGQVIYGLLEIMVAVAGAIASGRQVWLQHQPPGTVAACVPPLNFLIETKPLPEVIKLMFHGGQDCAQVLWRWGGLAMAEWMLLIFIAIIIALIVGITLTMCFPQKRRSY